MSPYRMEEFSREEMAAEDPFGGHGVFLAAPGADGTEMLARLKKITGSVVPALAWDQIGVWLDPGSTEASIAALRAAWGGSSEPEQRAA